MSKHFDDDAAARAQMAEDLASLPPEPARPPLSTLSVGRHHCSVALDELARLEDEGGAVYRQQQWDRMGEL